MFLVRKYIDMHFQKETFGNLLLPKKKSNKIVPNAVSKTITPVTSSEIIYDKVLYIVLLPQQSFKSRTLISWDYQ